MFIKDVCVCEEEDKEEGEEEKMMMRKKKIAYVPLCKIKKKLNKIKKKIFVRAQFLNPLNYYGLYLN